MAIPPKLMEFSDAKHVKLFSKYLKGIEKDLQKVGGADYQAEVIGFGQNKPSGWFFSSKRFHQNYSEPDESLIVEAEVHGCNVEIEVPITRKKVELPYFIFIGLRVPMTGQAEFRRGKFRNKWHLDPDDNKRKRDLKRSLPKITMIQAKGTPDSALVHEIEVGHLLKPGDDGNTVWTVNSGYNGGILMEDIGLDHLSI